MTVNKIKKSIIDLLEREKELTMTDMLAHFEEMEIGRNELINCIYEMISKNEINYKKGEFNRYYYFL